jgi:hypothetical protein
MFIQDSESVYFASTVNQPTGEAKIHLVNVLLCTQVALTIQ